MSNPFSFFKKPNSRLIIAADVGSYSIKTAIFEMSEKNGHISLKEKKIFYAPSSLPVKDNNEGKIMAVRLREIIFNFIKELKRVPDKIIIGLDGSFAESKINTLKFVRENPDKKITKDEMANFFDVALEEAKKKIAEAGRVVVASYPISIFVDGYEIKDLNIFVSGTNVLIKTFVLAVGAANAVEFFAISKMLGGIPVKFSSLVWSLGGAIAKKFSDGKNSAVLDIGGLYTNLVIVKEGKIDEIAGFHGGGNNFSGSLSKEFSIEAREAAELQRQYSQGIVTENEALKIKEIFSNEAAIWENGLVQALDGLAPADFFPPVFYITGGGANLPEIRSILESKKWVSRIIFSGNLNFIFLKAEDMLGGILSGEHIKGIDEASLASLVINS